jgi:hypothetical protein
MLQPGQSVPNVAQALGIGEGMLYQQTQAQRLVTFDQEL